MRLEPESAPDARHRGKADPDGFGHGKVVQWVVSPGGSVCVSATTRSATAGGSGAMRNGRVLSRTSPLDTLVHEPLLPAPHAGPALAGAPHDLVGAAAVGGSQHNPHSPHMFLGALVGRHDPLKAGASGGAHVVGDPCAHPAASHLGEPIPRKTLPANLFH